MAKKSNAQLENELQNKIEVLSNRYVDLIVKCGEEVNEFTEKHLQDKADTKKQLEQLKRDLRFIQSMKGKVDKKEEREKMKGQKEMVTRLKEIKNSIGELIADIPK